MIANDIAEKEEKDTIKNEFRKITDTVLSVKNAIDKNENQMGEIILKIENMVKIHIKILLFTFSAIKNVFN